MLREKKSNKVGRKVAETQKQRADAGQETQRTAEMKKELEVKGNWRL